MSKPKRRFTIEIEIGGDTWDDAARGLRDIAQHVEEHGPACKMVSGSPSCGYSVVVVEEPNATHESYFAELERYLSEQESKATT